MQKEKPVLASNVLTINPGQKSSVNEIFGYADLASASGIDIAALRASYLQEKK